MELRVAVAAGGRLVRSPTQVSWVGITRSPEEVSETWTWGVLSRGNRRGDLPSPRNQEGATISRLESGPGLIKGIRPICVWSSTPGLGYIRCTGNERTTCKVVHTAKRSKGITQ